MDWHSFIPSRETKIQIQNWRGRLMKVHLMEKQLAMEDPRGHLDKYYFNIWYNQ